MTRAKVYWLCQVLGWSAHAAANIAFAATYGGFTWRFVAIYICGAGFAILCTHGLRAWIHRRGWLQLPPLRVLPRVLLASIAAGFAISALLGSAWPIVFSWKMFLESHWAWVLPAIFIWSVTVFLWSAIYFGVHYFENYQTSEVENLRLAVVAKDAEVRALLAQINPHFVFNCLNSLRALIIEDPPRAQSMVTELAGMLRYSLQSGRTEAVSLETELEAVSAYLKLEAIRLEERLQIRIDVDPQSLQTQIPPMLLQTLVENGVKHGVARLPHGGEIRVASRMQNGSIRIQVQNSGQLAETGSSTRVGLENVRQRLRLLYGDRASLALRNLDATSVIAEVMIPAGQPS